MVYKLVITKKAEELLDNLVYYLLYQLNSEQAASRLIDGISRIYSRLEENPFQFPRSKDMLLNKKEYREAIIPDMNYIIIYRIEGSKVFILGIFHGLENYIVKL